MATDLPPGHVPLCPRRRGSHPQEQVGDLPALNRLPATLRKQQSLA